MKLSRALQIGGFSLLALLIALSGCKKKQPASPSETRDVFGTQVTITILDPNQDPAVVGRIFEECFGLMGTWDTRTLKTGPQNQVAKISTGAGQESVPVDATTFDLLMKGMRLYDNGGKVYDIRYGPLLDLWGFDSKPRVPTKAELDTVQTLVTNGGMFVAGNSILLAREKMRFDVREIVVGYVFDQIANRLAELGIRSAIISAPGVWRLMGDPPTSKGFEIGLRNPLKPDSVWTTIHVPAGGVSMQSSAEGRFTADGKTYHRLLDPRTGMPASNCAAAVVHAPDAVTAEALAYSLFVTGAVDSFDTTGKQAVLGSMIVKESGGKLTHTSAGSLSTRG